MRKKVTVKYYAVLRQQSGITNETIETSARTVSDLYIEVSKRYSFQLPQRSMKVAVNDNFAPWDYEMQDCDLVVFIPPVAGG